MIKHIFFDLDDTIFDFKAAEKSAIAKTFESLNIDYKESTLQRYSDINKMCWEALERGELTRSQVLSTRFKLLFSELKVNIEPLLAQSFYEKNLAEGHIFIDGSPQILQDLYGKYKLYIVSNGTQTVQNSRIDSSGIAKYFEKIFISEKFGVNKPSLEFFEKVFSKIENFKKEESIIVGDSLTSDILGGINSGIKTCLFDPSGKKEKSGIVPDFRIKELRELKELLPKI